MPRFRRRLPPVVVAAVHVAERCGDEVFDGQVVERVEVDRDVVAADGTATGGSIFMKDGKTCFLVEGEEQENCFTDGPRQPDGTMQTTSANGNVSTVRPVQGSLDDHVETET